jgi:hypothetical protein
MGITRFDTMHAVLQTILANCKGVIGQFNPITQIQEATPLSANTAAPAVAANVYGFQGPLSLEVFNIFHPFP